MLDRIDRYELKERIGAGGQATVYLAEDTVLERQVAVKVMNQIVSEEEAFADRFMKEARLAANLTHRNIATVYDFKIEKDYACIVMEYLPNSVDKILHRNGPLAPPRASQITIHAAEALQHAHNNGVVHRDIKPHNILISSEGMAKVTDFGIARASDLISTTDTMGTPVYMSPEQCRRENISDVRSDIYSLGISFYEMLSGHPPFQGSYQELTEAHLSQPVPKFDPSLSIPASLESIVMKCLAKDPTYRFQTSQELATALRALFGGNTPQANNSDTNYITSTTPDPEQTSNPMPTPVEVILKPSRWSRIVAAMSLAAAVIFLIVNSEKVLNQFRDIDDLVPGRTEKTSEAFGKEQVNALSPSIPPVLVTESANRLEQSIIDIKGNTKKADIEEDENIKENDNEKDPEIHSSLEIRTSDKDFTGEFELTKIEEMEYSVQLPWSDGGGLSYFSKISVFDADLGESTTINVLELSSASLENIPDDSMALKSIEFALEADINDILATVEFDLNKEWLESEAIDLDRIVLLATDGDEWYELETHYLGMSRGPSNQYYQRFEAESEGFSIYLISVFD